MLPSMPGGRETRAGTSLAASATHLLVLLTVAHDRSASRLLRTSPEAAHHNEVRTTTIGFGSVARAGTARERST